MNKHEETVKIAINMCLKVIKAYEWLSDLYVLDFFVDNHWSKLPQCWQECFNDMDPKTLGDILAGHQTKHMLPLSLLALIKSVTALSIPRVNNYKSNTDTESSREQKWGSNPKFKNLFLKHVKLKKRHEINMMSDFVSDTVTQTNCNAVLDFGSGLGHLIRILSYKYNINTVGIEMQTKLTEEARKLDLELEYTVKKQLTGEQISNLLRPNHMNLTLSSLDQLEEIPLQSIKQYGLIGLHPCGDLGPLLIKHFVNSKKVKFICVVGCCFMKLSCNKDPCGYPMSNYLKNLNNGLSYTSREISCHAIETYCRRLRKGDYKDLKVHAYRAALEKLLQQKDPKLKHMPIRSVKHTNDMTFERIAKVDIGFLNARDTFPVTQYDEFIVALYRHDVNIFAVNETWLKNVQEGRASAISGYRHVHTYVRYCTAALHRLSIESLSYSDVEADLVHWKRVVVLYTLRLAVAPLVETLILFDRVLYILENGISCSIYPVFDPEISPRNHIIVGKKM